MKKAKYFLVFEEGDRNLIYEVCSGVYYSVPSNVERSSVVSAAWPYLVLPIILASLHMIDNQTAQLFYVIAHSDIIILVASILLGILLGCLFARRVYAANYASVNESAKLDKVLVNGVFVKKALKRFYRQMIALGATSLIPLGAFVFCWCFGMGHLSFYLLLSVGLSVFVIAAKIVCPFSKIRYLKNHAHYSQRSKRDRGTRDSR
jgi:heme exporter protein D/uncharacterized integral membrane protein